MPRRNGYTLIEMLIALAVLALATGIIAPPVLNMIERFDKRIERAEARVRARKDTFRNFLTDADQIESPPAPTPEQ